MSESNQITNLVEYPRIDDLILVSTAISKGDIFGLQFLGSRDNYLRPLLRLILWCRETLLSDELHKILRPIYKF